MSDENVWSPGDEGAAAARSGPSARTYGQGMWISQAFSPDVALRIGFALFRERPGLMLLLGAGLWFLTNLPTFLSMPGDFTVGVLEGLGETDSANLVDLVNNLVAFGAYVVIFPFQCWVTTSGLRAIVRHIERDDADASGAWSGYVETAWVIAYRILYSLILGVAAAIVVGPLAAVAVWAYVFQSSLSGAVALGIVALAALLALYVWIGLPLGLGTLACAIDGVNAGEALSIAWQAGAGSRATLFVFGLVFGILSVVGVCFFCVGQAPVLALQLGASAGGWFLYSRSEEAVKASPFFQRNLPDLT